MLWFSAKQVAKDRGLATATITGLIDDGELEAVNVARRGSKRRRFRISEAMLRDFDERRATKPAPTSESKSSRRTIQRPTKDYFATITPTSSGDVTHSNPLAGQPGRAGVSRK